MSSPTDEPIELPSRWREIVIVPIFWTARLFYRLFGNRYEAENYLWEERLDYRLFVQGMPAILAITMIAALGLLGVRRLADIETRYANAAVAATERNDFASAALCYDRLLELNPNVVPYRFNLGIVSEKGGDDAKAAALIVPLAPADSTGYGPAHLWMVEHLIRGEDQESRSRWEQAESHLLRLRRQEPGLADPAEKALTQLYVRQGRVDEILSDPRLKAIAAADADLEIEIAKTLALRDRRNESAALARSMIEILRRRVDEHPDDKTARLHFGEALMLSGDARSAFTVLRQGVTLHPGGPFEERLVDVAVAQALQLQASTVAPASEKKSAAVEAAALVKRYGGDSLKTKVQLGQLSRLAGDTVAAERYYLAAIDAAPAVRVELADLYHAVNREADALAQCAAFETSCREKLNQGQELTGDERRLAAAVARLQKHYSDAETWLRGAEPSGAIRDALVQLYLEWWDSFDILAPDAKPAATRVDLLQQALRTQPWNTQALTRLIQVARLQGTGGDEARAMLKQMVAESDMPAMAYLLLGSDAFERGDAETAQRYLQQAQRLDPQSSIALNNLAWTMLHADKPDLVRAERLANAAVALSPKDPHCRDTRFRILVRLGRYQDALPDLEFCAKAFAGDADFHRIAADVYDHLKLPELAAEHRRRGGK